MSQDLNRRQVIKVVTITGAIATVVLPSKWAKPVIEAVIVPAHAQSSPHATTAPPTTAL